jgi:hypothetical protein
MSHKNINTQESKNIAHPELIQSLILDIQKSDNDEHMRVTPVPHPVLREGKENSQLFPVYNKYKSRA